MVLICFFIFQAWLHAQWQSLNALSHTKKNRHTYQCEESVEVFLLVYPKLKFHTGDSVVGFSRVC